MNHHQYLNEKEGNKNRKDKSKQKKKKKKVLPRSRRGRRMNIKTLWLAIAIGSNISDTPVKVRAYY